MTQILYGECIGKQGKLRLGCSAILFDGESVAEGCAREVWEETGLRVRVIHLTGVYSDPHHVVVYPDGNQAHIVVLNFEVELLSGELNLSNETTGLRWFPVCEAMDMDLFHNHVERIRGALAGEDAAFIR
jgi:8-oxo-dGTP pyrophosphatase MutT (NUDIX family)